jgi:GNAT superfamily N-acetyltransferase
MSELSIVRATAEDVDVLHPLVEGYRDFYKQAPNIKTAQYLSDRLANNELIGWIAYLDGAPVGFTVVYPTFSTVSLSQIWLLNDLFVLPAARGHKVASQIMQVVEDAAREAGATRVFLRTANDNTAAQALYEGRGWVQDTVFRRYDLIF